MAVTIHDIAHRLGISISAVSMALGGYPDISEETRRKVIQASLEMGYTPNQAARQLRRQKAESIGYILPAGSPRFADPFFTEFLVGLSNETAVQPYDLLVSIAPPGEEMEKKIYKKWVMGHKVDGFILTHMHLNDWRVQYLTQNNVPFAALENSQDELDFPRIEINRTSGMVKLISHLVDKGFSRIAFIGGPPDLKIQVDLFEGFCQGLKERNIILYNEYIFSGDLTSTSGYQLATHLLSNATPPDAIVCINDETAFGVLHAAHDKGYDVGKNLGVTGFNGVQASSHTEPPLTTLDIPVIEIACELVQMLAAEISGKLIENRHRVIDPRLLLRESTGD